MTTSPGKMDLTALAPKENRLGGLLKPREALQPAPAAVPELQEPAAEPAAAPDEAAHAVEGAVDTAVDTAVESAVNSPAGQEQDDAPADAVADAEQPAAAHPADSAVRIEPAAEEHSGHVTLYLPGDLNQWLAGHHDGTGVSYPGIVLNAISWAAGENRLAEIFAPVDSPIPANDIFGRAPAITKPVRGAVEPETRPLRFRKDHMQVIISLARTWTADNRNAFFVGVLSAYRGHQSTEESVQTSE